MIDFFNQNQASFWFLTGFVLLAIEVLAFGFTSGVLLFGSIGALIAGSALFFGWVPHTWLAGIALFTLSSVASALLLWKPLKKLQDGGELGGDQSSDLIGYQFRLDSTVTLTSPGSVKYSGVDWRVELDDSEGEEQIDAGQKVSVSRVNAGVFQVKRAI